MLHDHAVSSISRVDKADYGAIVMELNGLGEMLAQTFACLLTTGFAACVGRFSSLRICPAFVLHSQHILDSDQNASSIGFPSLLPHGLE